MRHRLILFAAAATVATLLALGETAVGSSPNSIAAPGAKANIYVVASKSFCIASGVADAYTGNGKVIFYLTLRNSGYAAGKVNIIPVRHYDDGEYNASPMDMLTDVSAPARATKRYRSPAYTYKAHEHEIVSCGAKISGQSEVRIGATSL